VDLYEAFGLAPGTIVTAVGGGGKTSLVFALALEAAARGLSSLVTTTVKFTEPPGMALPEIIEAAPGEIASYAAAALQPGKALVAINGHGERGRMLGFQPAIIDQMAHLSAGLITVEGDGSSHRPFKAPAPHEPVIPSSTTDVMVCVGLGVLAQPLDERWVHRPELVAALSESHIGEPVTVSTILRVLLHPEGGRKGIPGGARIHALLNNPQTPEHEAMGVHIAERLVYAGYTSAIVATAHRQAGVRAAVR
jgi:molybdenum cofactor cytidylyltransferase